MQNPPSTLGGLETFTKRLVGAVPEVHLIVGVARGEECAGSFSQLRLPRVGPRSIWFAVRLWIWLLLHRQLIETLLVHRVEHILPALLAGVARRTVVAIHGSSRYARFHFSCGGRRIHLLLEAISVLMARKLIVLLDSASDGYPYYQSRYGRWAHKIYAGRVLVPALPQRRGVLGRPLGQPAITLAYVGRLETSAKRVDALPRLCTALREAGADIRLVIYGSGPYEANLKSELTQRGFAGAFRIATLASAEEFAPGLHVGIVTSRFEGQCMAALELISSGVPVVATHVGDMEHYATWGPVVTVAAAEYESPEACALALADGVLRVVGNYEYYAKVADSARQLVHQRFWTEAIDAWRVHLGVR